MSKVLFIKIHEGRVKINDAITNTYLERVTHAEALSVINSIEYIDVPHTYAESINEALIKVYENISNYDTFVIKESYIEASYI